MIDAEKLPTLAFPPYGVMNNEYLKNLKAKPIVPPHFKCANGADPEHCEREWEEARDQLIDELSDALWPVWDPHSQSWKGGAAARMLCLTQTDMKILMDIRTGRNLPMNSLPEATLRSVDCATHDAFFREEDVGKIFNSYPMYDRTLDEKLPAAFNTAFMDGLTNKCSTVVLQFKRRLQRPRSLQMAPLLGHAAFTLEEAVSSMTPSMISGHSLQGLVGAGAVMENILESGMTFSTNSWQALRQYAVDIGDRRVMAGVHYPSDNLGSWIVLMWIANRIYRSPQVKEMLWWSIEQGLVYRLIQQSHAEVYAPGLALLHRMRQA